MLVLHANLCCTLLTYNVCLVQYLRFVGLGIIASVYGNQVILFYEMFIDIKLDGKLHIHLLDAHFLANA